VNQLLLQETLQDQLVPLNFLLYLWVILDSLHHPTTKTNNKLCTNSLLKNYVAIIMRTHTLEMCMRILTILK